MATLREKFIILVTEHRNYYFFDKFCDAISEEDLKKMLIKEGMVTG